MCCEAQRRRSTSTRRHCVLPQRLLLLLWLLLLLLLCQIAICSAEKAGEALGLAFSGSGKTVAQLFLFLPATSALLLHSVLKSSFSFEKRGRLAGNNETATDGSRLRLSCFGKFGVYYRFECRMSRLVWKRDREGERQRQRERETHTHVSSNTHDRHTRKLKHSNNTHKAGSSV